MDAVPGGCKEVGPNSKEEQVRGSWDPWPSWQYRFCWWFCRTPQQERCITVVKFDTVIGQRSSKRKLHEARFWAHYRSTDFLIMQGGYVIQISSFKRLVELISKQKHVTSFFPFMDILLQDFAGHMFRLTRRHCGWAAPRRLEKQQPCRSL